MILITASHTVMIVIIHAIHTVTSLLIIHASLTVIIHAILTVMSLLIIHASPTAIIHASQFTISHNQPIIKLSSSYISLINLLANAIKEYHHHNETFYQLLSN